ncbi:MAG: hypothetical protein JST16_11830 [Bdellovibrionales bacterium]|nr:hypothetical protein [Bdellovibrionales bacterium]
MFELSGTHFEKGVFELQCEQPSSEFAGRILALGPLKGRLVALSFLLAASYLLYFQVPARTLMRWGWASDPFAAHRIQGIVVWGVVGLGLVIYMAALSLRPRMLTLTFDRGHSQVSVKRSGGYRWTPVKEDLAAFSSIKAIRVHGAHREPYTPHGFLELELPTLEDESLRVSRFRFLSDDQFRIYPLNIAKLTGVVPTGDWTDPDDEPLKKR